MRVVFAGTPEFAALALQALLDAGMQVPLVLTQSDRPAGRGLKLRPSPVKQLAQQHSIPVAQPRSLRLDGKHPDDARAARLQLQALAPDAMVVAAYGLILPPWVLELPRLGCINIHASLLPRWRGAAPIQRAIEAGDAHSGVTIMQMDAGLDTGDMLLAESVPIADRTTAGELHDALAASGARLVVTVLQRLARGELQSTPQPEQGASYAHKISKDEAELDWTLPAPVLARRIHAFNPHPGARTTLDGQMLKLWRVAAPEPGALGASPGQILEAEGDRLLVACGTGALQLLELQRAGSRRMPVRDFLAGNPLTPGQVLGAPASAD